MGSEYLRTSLAPSAKGHIQLIETICKKSAQNSTQLQQFRLALVPGARDLHLLSAAASLDPNSWIPDVKITAAKNHWTHARNLQKETYLVHLFYFRW